MTKKDHIKICQSIRDQYKDGEYLNFVDYNIINNYLKSHRWYKQKSGNQEYKIYVDTVWKYRTRGFFVKRADGSTTDFSFYECIYPTKGYKTDFIKAARSAISKDIIIYKKKKYPSIGSLCVCELCHKKVDIYNSHVDHYPDKFRYLLDNFIRINNIKDFEKLTKIESHDNIIGSKIIDNLIESKWIKYHHENAGLRILCKTCNMKLG